MSDESLPPLTAAEERTWRGLIRLLAQLPRALDEDLSRRGDISMTRYVVLMRLSEAPGRSLRMSDLAQSATISPSRMTRIIQFMTAEGLVSRQAAPDDARASLATLTDAGVVRLREAWPAHLAGVRALVMDHLDAEEVAVLHRITSRLLTALEQDPSCTKERR